MTSWRTIVMAASMLAAAPLLAAATVGQPAPALVAADATGRTVRLADFAGRVVVVEWTNPACPFVQKHYTSDNIPKLQADAKAAGVIWLTVNSSAPGTDGHLDGAGALASLRATGAAPAAYLLDADGSAGRAWGARTTPQVFIVDAKGIVVYAGAIDDLPSADPADVGRARNHVREALADLAAGRAVATPTSRPYGCSVRYQG